MSKPMVLCGVSGGIAAYKAAELVSRLHKSETTVRVVMTPAAQRFIQPLTFQAILGVPVGTEMFCSPEVSAREGLYPHLYPSGQADLYVVAPATADTLSKLVHGQADDLVCASALGLSATCIRVFCPAMNTNMWNQPVVQANVKTLEERGWIRIGPDAGHLACGTSGEGRMAEPDFIASRLLHLLRHTGELTGKQVLILSGPTREHLDPVRFISNPSSGKMGRALAEEALARGGDVTFISGPVPTENKPAGHPRLTFQSVISADDMLRAAREAFPSSDVTLFAAAVADYAPAEPTNVKRPKSSRDLTLSLRPTPDIAATLGALKQPHQRTVGFALQDEEGRKRAAEKQRAKKLDLIVLNSLAAMEADHAEYEALGADTSDFTSWGSLSKTECAARIFDVLATRGPLDTDLSD